MSLPDGIYTPVPTYFTDDFGLDLDTQIKQAKTLYEAGIKGLVIAGSMGESIHLTRKERLTLVSTIRKEIPDKEFKLILGMPYTNMADTVDEISEAKKVGADYAILLTPGYYGNSLTHQQGIIDYFKLVSDKSELPIIIYHYPGVSNGTEINPKTFQTLKTFENIIAVKLTHFNMDRYILLTQGNEEYNFKPFTGLGQILIPSLSIGAHGAIDGLSGIFPKCMVHLYNLYKSGEVEKAKELQFLVTSANQMIFDINLVGVKNAMKKIHGLGNGKARPPLSNVISEETWSKYEEDLEKLNQFEKSL
ncbi:putative L-threo-3-deoxy-hexylosonate aldolase [[Candida] jaroonii]|uniref:L-threo-3-deoxy-hexylosonate aldolase n=1 Tax=[Candida] jaroonii TaxID=467808 RepID=A0ACA9YDZ9_9ASCO|nr:putative L-threo-3-deoxy-hexylosonate aldolase [[Candida] jaroonii]